MTQAYDVNCPKCGGTGYISKRMGYFAMVIPCDCNKREYGTEMVGGLPPDQMIDTNSDLFKKMFGKPKVEDAPTTYNFDDLVDEILNGDIPDYGVDEPKDGKEKPLTDEDYEIPFMKGTFFGVDPHCIGSDFSSDEPECPLLDLEPRGVHEVRLAKERLRALLRALERGCDDPSLLCKAQAKKLTDELQDLSEYVWTD